MLLDNVNWERFDSDYRGWMDMPVPDTSDSEWAKGRQAAKDQWKKEKEEHLDSAALRVRDKVLMGEVVKEGYRGKLPLDVIYGETLGAPQAIQHVHYIVASTKPKGELRVAENSRLVLMVRQPL
jgi:hypothetical protein